ncbi:MAG: biotin--[acetyl-CoA-carboxylase] ligase [Bacteroidetes bacterium]|jgi:BirA family biotin operon repressor/biotin-[acetyl-CoA-carboxylase] ligase|nr:biotin--[acetyl-CoA-carboxylase] ligase [Bacteroidota bacterium]
MFYDAQWFFLEETDSTNNAIQQKLAQGILPEGSVVLADYQSSGKGQRGNSWQSNPGENLLFSMVLYPVFLKAESLFWLSKAIALAATDFVANHCHEVQIKWPNDIYVSGKKAGGILIENTFRGSEIYAAIVGIGLNLNQYSFEEQLSKATSMRIASGKNFDVRTSGKELFECIQHRYAQLKQNAFELLDNDYHRLLYRLHIPSKFRSNNHVFNGVIKSVNAQGLLLIDTPSGQQTFDIKEIVFLD